MKKKTLALLLALSISAGLLGGCGDSSSDTGKDSGGSGKQESGETPAESGDSKEGAGAADGESYELVVELMTYGMTPADMEMVEEAINEITVPRINATVKFLPITVADHATKVGMLAAGGEKVDLIMTGITSSPATLYADGILTDIGDLLNEHAPELVALEGELLEVGTFNGGVYSVPGVLYPGEALNLLYNKSMAEEYGINIPESLDSYEDWDAFFAEAKSKLPENVYAFTLGDGGGSSTVNWDSTYDALGDTSYLSYGVLTEAETGTEIDNWYATDKYKKLAEKRKEWYDAGYCVPDSMTSGYSTLDCMAAETCFSFQNPFKADCNEVTLSKNCGGVELGYIKLSDALITGNSTSLMSWGVPITSEKPEKAVQFLNLMFTDPELMNLLNFGIEGVHYEKVSERIVGYPEGVDAMSCGWGGFINWFGDNAKSYQFAPNTEEYFDDLVNYGLGKARVSKAMGYTFDASAVSTELAAVTNVIDTNKPSLECGLVNVDEKLPQFLTALEEAGLTKIMEENQKQFTEWLSNKQ